MTASEQVVKLSELPIPPIMGRNPVTVQVYLSRRNLETLLSKLDEVKAGGLSFCTIIKGDTSNAKYPQSHPVIAVTAVENEDYYIDREPGVMRGD